jgi:hypothetical protein
MPVLALAQCAGVCVKRANYDWREYLSACDAQSLTGIVEWIMAHVNKPVAEAKL